MKDRMATVVYADQSAEEKSIRDKTDGKCRSGRKEPCQHPLAAIDEVSCRE